MSFNIFDIAGSGMMAQRIKMDTVASNIANVNTTRNPDGSPGVYLKKDVTFRTKT
jgi:flagellar basal-body rod protein FlgC